MSANQKEKEQPHNEQNECKDAYSGTSVKEQI
jgi:hypothetical protein